MSDKALLAGINNYRWISDLRGCVNDVDNIQSMLTDVAGFPTQNVRVLTNNDVRKERIAQGWDWLLQNAAPGDRLVFHFSGHGSYTTDLDEDEPDGVDELICLHDMDWDDNQTYLLDDELREFTSRIPQGVFLTIILDSCHSGTGTRMAVAPGEASTAIPAEKTPEIDLPNSLARLAQDTSTRSLAIRGEPLDTIVQRLLLPRSAAEQQNVTLVRFVEPPPKVVSALHRFGVRSTFRAGRAGKAPRTMNHVLLAGSKDTQTSADAHIDGDYNGAFSYYLCQAIREGGAQIDYQDLIRRVRTTVEQERFSQVPQLEPENQTGPVFGQSRPQEVETMMPGATVAWPDAATSRELLDVLREVRDLLQRIEPGSVPERRADATEGLVYVHGICKHEAGYSRAWWNAMSPHLSPPTRRQLQANRREVLWSDLVTPDRGARTVAAPRQWEREQDLADLLRDVLADRAQREKLVAIPVQEPDRTPSAAPQEETRALFGIPGLDCVDDFVKYLVDDQIRRDVQQRFLDKVESWLQTGVSIEVISHSWGTVVAYEALRSLDRRSFSGSVHNLFTVGSALSITSVQRQLEPPDRRRPRHVRRWVNLDAHGDIVGGSLRESGFGVDLEFLNLYPSGCESFWGIVSPACAHSSYFHADNVAVNRGVFAAQIHSD